MFNYKNINLRLLSLALFTTVGVHNINGALARLPKVTDSINAYFYININQVNTVSKSNEQAKIIDINNLSAFEGFSSSAGSSKTKTFRKVSLYLFLLLFILFGVFYPFFLFYKRLLNVDKSHNNLTDGSIKLNENSESKLSITSFPPESLKFEESSDHIQAVVSKLQIAFAARDNDLRQKLVELCSSIDSRTDQGVAELMRKTVSLLISEDNWTHVSLSSDSFSVDRIKTEFEAICIQEKNKLVGKKSSVVEGNTQESTPSNLQGKGDEHYMVVTLVLCTSHTTPLFTEISTKKQLLAKLSDLGKMSQDSLIKFDLLWNPNSESEYLNNNELLINYTDMMRLF